MTTQQPEALRMALDLEALDIDGIAAELCRQHARIAELEAQLESIGAGGVSGPLMGRTDSKEREAFERALMDLSAQHGATVSTSDLSRDASGAYDNGMTEIAWMLWQVRASIAASAGSEPVAQLASERDELFQAAIDFIRTLTGMEPPPIEVAPPDVFAPFHAFVNTVQAITNKRNSPPREGMVGGRIALPGALPEPGVPVLLDIGKKYPIRAMWAPAKTLEESNDSDAVGDYDEATDTYYCPEGWYEWNECEDTHWRVTETPRAWAPLPPTTPAGSGKGGES